MEARAAPAASARRAPGWLAALAPLLVLGLAIALFVGLDAPGLDRTGVPQESLAVERAELRPGEIELHVVNDGADPVAVRQVIVNDSYVPFSQSAEQVGRLAGGEIRVDYPWIEGERYAVVLLTATGATVEHVIEAAAETPAADLGFYGLMALIGLYVGVIPVAIGMLWLPWLRSVDPRALRFLLALTVGLLAFLAIDAMLEGSELAGEGAAAFGGAVLVWLGAAGAYLALAGVDGWLRGREGRPSGGAAPTGGGGDAAPLGDAAPPAGTDPPARAGAAAGAGPAYRLALLVAVGIGLHNLGEGLAIGAAYAVGSLALGASLVAGFALHNTTEGLAIVAPVARSGQAATRRLGRLVLLGLVAGAPAIVGAWLGASAFEPSLAAFMFGLGAGAIARVVVQIAPSLRDAAGRPLDPVAATGLVAGLALMYVTGLLVSV